MKRTLTLLTACLLFIMTFTGCVSDNLAAKSLAGSNKNSDTLPAVELTGNNKFFPAEGITMETARDLIVDYLAENGTKGDIRSSLELEEVTVKESWENVGVQVYRVDLDYGWLYGLAVVKDGKVLCVLDGMPTHKIFLGDLDGDNKYEVYTNISFGSGFVSREIRGYNISTGIKYRLSERMKRDLFLFIKDDGLWVEEYSPNSSMEKGPITINRLSIKNGTLELMPSNSK